MIATLFDPGPPDPKKDDAPLTDRARVKGTNIAPKRTRRVRETSREAYLAIGPAAGTQAARILAAIIARGPEGLTDDEGERQTHLSPQTYTPRRGELVRDNFVIDSGQTRPTASGRNAIVWIAASEKPGEVRS